MRISEMLRHPVGSMAFTAGYVKGWVGGKVTGAKPRLVFPHVQYANSNSERYLNSARAIFAMGKSVGLVAAAGDYLIVNPLIGDKERSELLGRTGGIESGRGGPAVSEDTKMEGDFHRIGLKQYADSNSQRYHYSADLFIFQMRSLLSRIRQFLGGK